MTVITLAQIQAIRLAAGQNISGEVISINQIKGQNDEKTEQPGTAKRKT